MWFLMAQRPYKNYGIVVGWKCSYSRVIFTIHDSYIPRPSQGAYLIQFPGFFFAGVLG